MDEVNYNEKVILPFLEKKCKDLLSLNLVLEAKLLVEQNKGKDSASAFQAEFEQIDNLKLELERKDLQINHINQEFKTCMDDRSKIIQEKNELSQKVDQLQSQLSREISIKDSTLAEYRSLKSSCDKEVADKNEEIRILNSTLVQMQTALDFKAKELITLKEEYDALKVQLNTKKSK